MGLITTLIVGIAIIPLINAAPQTLILNGNVADDVPSYTLIFYTVGSFFGGGHLITNKHVLTAGHCIYGSSYWVVWLGSNQIFQKKQVLSFEAVHHELYNPNTRANNIGVIILPEQISFTDSIQPIQLPALYTTLPLENEQGAIFGFGWTSAPGILQGTLKSGFQRVINHAACQQAFPAIQLQSEQTFCAQDPFALVNICTNDLGGGFIVPYRGTPTLVGIASMNVDQCSVLHPAGYTKVSIYVQWIINVTHILKK